MIETKQMQPIYLPDYVHGAAGTRCAMRRHSRALLVTCLVCAAGTGAAQSPLLAEGDIFIGNGGTSSLGGGSEAGGSGGGGEGSGGSGGGGGLPLVGVADSLGAGRAAFTVPEGA